MSDNSGIMRAKFARETGATSAVNTGSAREPSKQLTRRRHLDCLLLRPAAAGYFVNTEKIDYSTTKNAPGNHDRRAEEVKIVERPRLRTAFTIARGGRACAQLSVAVSATSISSALISLYNNQRLPGEDEMKYSVFPSLFISEGTGGASGNQVVVL